MQVAHGAYEVIDLVGGEQRERVALGALPVVVGHLPTWAHGVEARAFALNGPARQRMDRHGPRSTTRPPHALHPRSPIACSTPLLRGLSLGPRTAPCETTTQPPERPPRRLGAAGSRATDARPHRSRTADPAITHLQVPLRETWRRPLRAGSRTDQEPPPPGRATPEGIAPALQRPSRELETRPLATISTTVPSNARARGGTPWYEASAPLGELDRPNATVRGQSERWAAGIPKGNLQLCARRICPSGTTRSCADDPAPGGRRQACGVGSRVRGIPRDLGERPRRVGGLGGLVEVNPPTLERTMDPTPEPLTLTVEEAARILRIGRTTAYALAREWRTTRRRSGLPVLELGRSLRVPRSALARLLHAPMFGVAAEEVPAPSSRPRSSPSRRARDEETAAQGTLWAQAPEGATSSR